MKKWIKIAGLLLLSLPVAVHADLFYYTTNADNTITITGYSPRMGGYDPEFYTDITIPDTIDGLPVTCVFGQNVFSQLEVLGNVTIPNSVTNIGDYAFENCVGLTNVTLGTGITSITDGTFRNCASLTGITIPDGGTSIGYEAFSGCTGLTSVRIPDSVTSIGIGAFMGCAGLTNAILGSGVANIGNASFYACTSLNSVTIPSSVVSLEGWAFGNCTSLTEVYFEGNSPSIGDYVFSSSDNVTVYYLPDTTNWTNPWAGRPTVLWNPQIQTDNADFGVRSNGFGFNITGTNDFTVVVEACTNLASGIWKPVETNTLTGGSVQFSDPAFTNYPKRYYRVSMPQ